MSATEQALAAHQAALEAAALEAAQAAALEAEEARRKEAHHKAAFEAAKGYLGAWFPGVEWVYYPSGDYGHDTIVMEAGADWSDPLKIKVEHYDVGTPEGGDPHYRTRLFCVERVQDTSLIGHSYWSGPHVKSAADVGRWLAPRLTP